MPRTVLLADDSVTAQNMGRRILTDAGYEVITVNNGSAALKKIHESKPDLIVLDVYMPGYGGLEVCQRLKESDATMKIPVLLTVGKMEPFKADEAKRVRADGHIVKPFDASELLAALTRLEDRIVPQSESGRGKSAKLEAKKPRRWRGEEIVAQEDESRNNRISYLEEAKKRQAQPKDPEAEVGADQETTEDAVTFASGPINQPAPAREIAAPEFPVQRESEREQVTEKASEGAPAVETAEAKELTESEAATSEQTTGSSMAAESEPEAEEVKQPTQVEPGPRWVVENVAVTAEETSRSLDEEMRQAQATSEPAATEEQTAEVAEESAPQISAREETPEPPAHEDEPSSGAAFAAAASASNSLASTNAVAENSPAPTESSSGPEAETAWRNWEHIRDSVVGQQAAAAIAESVAAMAQGETAEQDSPAPKNAENESKPAADASSSQEGRSSDALSSIVDNVLAELKPRLLAEIAKQLSNDKK